MTQLDPRKYGTDALRGIFDASPDNAVPAESSAVPLQENGIIAPATPLTPLVKPKPTFLSGFVPPDYIVDGLMKRGSCIPSPERRAPAKVQSRSTSRPWSRIRVVARNSAA